jgi:hypothetical protein
MKVRWNSHTTFGGSLPLTVPGFLNHYISETGFTSFITYPGSSQGLESNSTYAHKTAGFCSPDKRKRSNFQNMSTRKKRKFGPMNKVQKTLKKGVFFWSLIPQHGVSLCLSNCGSGESTLHRS